MSNKIKEAIKHAADKPAGNLLASLTVEYMRSIKVVLINKPSMSVPTADAALVTLKRHLENPDLLAVNGEGIGEGQYPIFNRTDIDVNNEESIEERIELTSLDNRENKRNHFRKCSRSSSATSSCSRSPLTGSREAVERMPNYIREHNKNLRINPFKQNQKSYSLQEVCKVKQDANEHNLIEERGRSLKTSKFRQSRDREQNAEETCGASCRECNCKENSRACYKIDSSKHYNRNYNGSYCSGKSSYESNRSRQDKYTRSPSRSPKKYCKFPSNKRQGSPYYQKCSCSPTPDSKRQDSNFKENRERRKGLTERNARSPSREKSNSSHSKTHHTRERLSHTPYTRHNSRSPLGRRPAPSTKHSDNGNKPRSLSSSHKSNISYHYEENRNKSPSKHVNQYGLPPYSFGYYGAEGLWLPAPLQRSGFIPRNVMPPPMPMVGGPTYFIPRPYMSVPRPLHDFRPHGIPYRHRMTVSNESTRTTNAVHTAATTSANVMEQPSSTSDLNE